MAEPETKAPAAAYTLLAAQDAPFIYFDGTAAMGTNHGAVQIELAANILIPHADGTAGVNVVCTAHLRCSPAAAADLRQSIDKALEMLGAGDKPPEQALGRPN